MDPGHHNDEDRPGLLPRLAHAVRNIFPHHNNSNSQNRTQVQQAPQEDVEMSTSQTLNPSSAQSNQDDNPPHLVPEDDSDSDDSMPSLQSVSNSSDEEMSDGEDEGSEDEIIPMLVPRTSRRRSRGQEDNDEDRDRRNPAERTGSDPRAGAHSPQPETLPAQPPPPSQPPQQLHDAHTNVPHLPPMPFRFFDILRNPPPVNNDNNNNSNGNTTNNNSAAPNNGPGNPGRGNFVSGIAISIPGPDGRPITAPLPIPDGGNPLQFLLSSLLGGPIPGQPADGPGLPFGDFLTRFNDFMTASINESQREDPERAKRLVAGLEAVPTGLVKRLERVGDVGGGEDSGTGGDSVCAICWDSLLGGDVDAWKKAEETRDAAYTDPASVPLPASRSSTPTTESPPLPAPATTTIVSMPCAHVFHASCLLPWFTRPNQTTCPTCRFNIDPEGLTRSPPPPPQEQNGTQSSGAQPANEANGNNLNNAPHPPFPHQHDQDNDRRDDRGPQVEDIDVFLDLAVNVGFGDEEGMSDEDGVPSLNIFASHDGTGGFTFTRPSDRERPEDVEGMPSLEPIRSPPREGEGQASSSGANLNQVSVDSGDDDGMPPLEPVRSAPRLSSGANAQPLASSSSAPPASSGPTAPSSARTTSTARIPSQAPIQPPHQTPTPVQNPAPTPIFFGPPPPPNAQAPLNNDNNDPHISRFGFDIIFATDHEGNTRPIAGGFTDGEPPQGGEFVDEWTDEQVWVFGGPEGPVNANGDGAQGGPGIGLFEQFGFPFFQTGGSGNGNDNGPNVRPRTTPPGGTPAGNTAPATASNGTPAPNGTPPAANGTPTANPADGRPGGSGLSPADLLRNIMLGQGGARRGNAGPGGIGLGPRLGQWPPGGRDVFVFGGSGPNGRQTPIPNFGSQPSSSTPQLNPLNAQPTTTPNAQTSAAPNPQLNATFNNFNNETRRHSGPPTFGAHQAQHIPFAHNFEGLHPRPANPGPGANPNLNQAPRGHPPHTHGPLPNFASLFSGPQMNPIWPRAAGDVPQQPVPNAQRPNHSPFVFGPFPALPPRTQRTRRNFPRERKQWMLPSPPGLTLRQRVERAEREAGLRCDDVSCGVGPSDDEPGVNVRVDTVRIHDRNSKPDAESVEPKLLCSHKFHPSCLVSAERVAWNSKNEEEQKEVDDKEWIDVECPVCRRAGCVSKEVWQEGVRASSEI